MANELVGKTIKDVRPMTKREAAEFDWCSQPVVIELDDGTKLFPSSDSEGNRGGTLFGILPDGTNVSYA